MSDLWCALSEGEGAAGVEPALGMTRQQLVPPGAGSRSRRSRTSSDSTGKSLVDQLDRQRRCGQTDRRRPRTSAGRIGSLPRVDCGQNDRSDRRRAKSVWSPGRAAAVPLYGGKVVRW